MAELSLQTAPIACLAIWLAIWMLLLILRLSPLDIRNIRGIGMIMLAALVVVLAAPIAAAGLAGAALIRKPRALLQWLTFGFAVMALFGQALIVLVTQ